MRDLCVIFGFGVFMAALVASAALLVGRSSGDATGPVVWGLIAGLGLGFGLSALYPDRRK